MSGNIRETKIAVSYRKQSAIGTAQTAANCWSLGKTNASLGSLQYGTEDNSGDIGIKSHEFATQLYKLGVDFSGSIESYLDSHWAAFAAAFGMGGIVKATPVAGAYQYTCNFQDPVTDGIELPSFTYVEAIRQGGSAILDRASVGNIISGWTISGNSGIGRQNSRIAINFVGSGKITEPSTITIPAETTPAPLSAGSVAITINSTNYVSAKTIVSYEFGIENALRTDAGYYPGSGTDANGYQQRGRLEFGNRSCFLRFVARFKNGSTELATLRGLTEGTAVISLTGSLIAGSSYHGLTATFQRTTFRTAEVGEQDGLVTVAVDVLPLYHSSNGIFTMVATTNVDNIGS